MDIIDGNARIVRAPTRRKRNDEQLCDRIKLKKVLGLTVCSNAALDVSSVSGLLAYPAGCTVVLFNAKRQTQAYLVNTSRKAFTSVAFSRCGRYIATGECGINPAIKVWELEAANGNVEHCTGGNVVAEFVDHKYAVTCVAFSPTGKYLVSVGSQHDMIVNVFDWRSNLKMASNKISSRVSAVSFAEDGSYFVTVGNRHVKYWYLEGGRKYKDPIPLMGRSAILGDLRDNDFCAVACGKGITAKSTYAITRQGHLVEFSSRRLLDKWVQCRTQNANCLCVNERFILVGCAEAIIRIFNAATLEYVTTLPRTHYLGVDVSQGVHINHIMSAPSHAKYPDCIAMVFDEQRAKVSCVYNDHSLYIWDLRDVKRVGKSHSFLYHSTCIWGVETVPYNMERDVSHTLPEDCFVTCSSDDTVRVWGLDGCANNEMYRKNIYSKELLRVIYSDEDLHFIKDQEALGDKTNNSNYDGRNGVRCIKISPELQHIATGDRSGNIRVYNLSNLELLKTIEAHDSEVLCLEYSNDKIDRKLLASASRDRLIHVFDVAQNYKLLQTLDDHSSSITSIKFVGAGLSFQMISCGADKSIMFRTFQGNIFLRGTHTSGKTTLYDMEVDSNAKHILTACQDRNVRVYSTQNAKHTKTFKGSHSDEGSLIKLSLDPSGIYVATSCTDKTLAVYDYYSSECMARMYGHSELVTGLKFTNDCRHLISSSGDGCIFIWQVPHDMIVTMQARLSQQRLRSGHAPLQRPVAAISPPEGIIVESPTNEYEHLLNTPNKFVISPSNFIDDAHVTPGYRLSDVGQLPQWAKRKSVTAGGDSDSGAVSIPTSSNAPTMHSATSLTNLSSSPSQTTIGAVPRTRARWSQRSSQLDADDLRSNSESPLGTASSVGGISAANTQTSDYNSASSKDIMYNQTYLSEDSSIDSGMETRRELKLIGSNNTGTVPAAVAANNGNLSGARLVVDKRKPGLRFDTLSNEHDGDVEDISDGERTSSDHGMFYNNISPGTPTDFKVTAMNEDELRKSVRRQKFEKTGLTLSANGSSHTASTGTGTGTSDTEDEGSTPSAENADRSLASTLGGSSENIPQSTNSFLQAALPDGPGMLLERGSSNRRSISAKHNTENGKPVVAPPTITKSYTSTKKEELLQVINKVKQQLENVGHRPLRGSHSISDLSLTANLDGSRSAAAASRYAKTVASNENSQYSSSPQHKDELIAFSQENLPPNTDADNNTASATAATHQAINRKQPQAQPYQSQPQQQFFNCAAPKSKLQQNFQTMRKVQQHYPPYPHHVGVHQIHPPPGVPFGTNKAFNSATLPAHRGAAAGRGAGGSVSGCAGGHGNQESTASRVKRNPAGNTRRTPSILKHYKSCPVSPVHEEVEWSAENNSIIITEPKRHSVYADDARTILDMIHADTEKMIEEITRKYGDLDDIGVDVYDARAGVRRSQMPASYSMPANLTQSRQLPMPASGSRDSSREYTPTGTPPRRGTGVSQYYVYREYYQCERKVSLSDILNPEKFTETQRMEEARFLETQRHSSASFFLTSHYPNGKSQESLLSDDLIDDGSYCNSMESILSDESDCKSAPLEQMQVQRHAGIRNFIIHGPVATQLVTKSYGSSPNACGSFDYYMQHRNVRQTSSPLAYDSFDVSSYNLDNFQKREPIAPMKSLPNSKTYPRIAQFAAAGGGVGVGVGVAVGNGGCRQSTKHEEIPTLSSKNKQYSSGVSKSISQDFALQRQQRNTNPLQSTEAADRAAYENRLFIKKTVKSKPPIPAKPQNLVSALTSSVEATNSAAAKAQSDSLKKSCSFDIGVRSTSRTASVVRKFERNLQKFEREKQAELLLKKQAIGMRSSKSSGALATTQSCLKKVSKFDMSECSRRATSMRQRDRPKISVRFNTVSQIKYTPSAKRSASCGGGSGSANADFSTTTTCPLNDINRNDMLVLGSSLPNDYGEKTFEMYFSENGNELGNMNMDSMKLYTKPEMQAIVDGIQQERTRSDAKHKKNAANTKRTQSCADTTTSSQCKDIAKKIDVVEKLMAMEERKMEQIRLATETRLRPFECNSKQKGYVKSLTMNFDMLAKGIERDIEQEQQRILADGNDGDLCAYARHMKRNCSLPDVLESTDFTYTKLTQQQDVELAREVKADDDDDDGNDGDDDDLNEDANKARQARKNERSQGNPKNLLPMPIEESSIRRACSLSDLHIMGNMGKNLKSNGSALQKPTVPHRNSSTSRSASKRNSLQGKGFGMAGGLGASSNSMNVLNQGSDSEMEENQRGRSASNGQSRTNGPAAANRQYGNKSVNSSNNRRKGPNFSNSTNLQDDSSSEETQGGSGNAKPIVPPRPRNLTFDHKSKLLNNGPNALKQRAGGNGSSSSGGVGGVGSGSLDANDFEGGDPEAQLHNIINKLYTVTQTAVQFHANVNNSLLLKELENAVIMSLSMLSTITQNRQNDRTNNTQTNNHAYTATEQTNLDNGDYLMMVNNCADLLSNLRMKHKPDDCENHS